MATQPDGAPNAFNNSDCSGFNRGSCHTSRGGPATTAADPTSAVSPTSTTSPSTTASPSATASPTSSARPAARAWPLWVGGADGCGPLAVGGACSYKVFNVTRVGSSG